MTLCHAYQLGEVLEDPILVSEGLHRVWRLQTNTSIYAIKWINEHSLQLLQHNLNSPEESEHIACYMHQHHIPTVLALEQNGAVTLLVDNQRFMVFPWIEGKIFSHEEWTKNLLLEEQINKAMILGQFLASIQNTNYPESDALPNWTSFSEKKWKSLVDHLKNQEKVFNFLNEQTNFFIHLNEQAKKAILGLQHKHVFSHRDLDTKNIIWQSDKPIILDWEYAGLIHPLLDLLIVALNLSHVISGNIHLPTFVDVIKGYKKINPFEFSKQTICDVFSAYNGYCLDWILYNVANFTDNAWQEIKNSLTALRCVEANKNQLIELITSV